MEYSEAYDVISITLELPQVARRHMPNVENLGNINAKNLE